MQPRLAAHLDLARISDDEFVERSYRLLLRRPPDQEGRGRALERLGEATLSRATFLQELASSDEFASVRALDDGIAHARWARESGERPRELRAPPGNDERAIEIPWVLGRYRGEPCVLDVGYAFAEPAYLVALAAAAPEDVVGLDLVEQDVPGFRGVVGDARRVPFPSRSFDVTLCVSTLEHVGYDTTVYGAAAERDERGPFIALRELRRVTRGRVLLTVPCGEPQELERFVQHDEVAWLELFRDAGFLVFEHETYALGEEGWRAGTASGRYGVDGATGVLCAELHPTRLGNRIRAMLRRLRRR